MWGNKKYIQHFLLDNLKERNHLEDQGINGTKMLKWILSSIIISNKLSKHETDWNDKLEV